MSMAARVVFLIVGVSFLPPRLTGQDDRYLDGLIAQLDGLREDATRDEFRRRPALMELLVLGDRAMPALGRAVKSENWSIRASALYLIASHANETAAQVWIQGFLHDPHPTVRAIAVAWCGRNFSDGIIKDFTQENYFIERWELAKKTLDWLPDDYYYRRLKLYLDILATDEPCADPSWSGDLFEFEIKPSTESAVRAVQYGLAGVRGHWVGDRLIELLLRIPEQEENKLGIALQVAAGLASHDGGSHVDGTACTGGPVYYDALCSLIETRVWGSSNPLVLDRGLMVLSYLASTNHDRVRLLIARFANEHPDKAVRERAGRIMEGREAPRTRKEPEDRPEAPVLMGANSPPGPEAVGPEEGSLANEAHGTADRHQERAFPLRRIALLALLGAVIIAWTLWRSRKPRLL